MASVFQYGLDLAFLTSKLAVEVQFDENQGFCYHGVVKARLAPNLPYALLGKF